MKEKESIIIFGLVWPEPNSSAAGVRMQQLIGAFILNHYEVHFLCAANPTDFSLKLDNEHIHKHAISINNESVNELLETIDPKIVVFDRFMTFEQFGWRVEKFCSKAYTILNMEDVHSIRDSRHKASQKNIEWKKSHFRLSDKWIREYTAVQSCDFIWVVSEFERDFLTKTWEVAASKVAVLPIVQEPKELDANKKFEGKLVMIGNFLHPPNLDSVQYALKEIWPILNKEDPELRLDIYGAYSEKKEHQLPKLPKNIRLLGRAEAAIATLSNYDGLLAPLRFGAGIKGKVLDAWAAGIPVITTAYGAEGMKLGSRFGGWECKSKSDYKKTLFALQSQEERTEAIKIGQKTLQQKFSRKRFDEQFERTLHYMEADFIKIRESNLLRAALTHHSLRGDEYFSRWIELKEQLKN